MKKVTSLSKLKLSGNDLLFLSRLLRTAQIKNTPTSPTRRIATPCNKRQHLVRRYPSCTLSSRFSRDGEQGLIGRAGAPFLLYLDLPLLLSRNVTFGGPTKHKHGLFTATWEDVEFPITQCGWLWITWCFLDVPTWSVWPCLTFFFFLCSDLVDDEQSHQVHTGGAATLRRRLQRDPDFLQPLLHFLLFKELLHIANKPSKWCCWSPRKFCFFVRQTFCFLVSLFNTNRFLQTQVS